MKNIWGERWKRIPETIQACSNNGHSSRITYHPDQIYEVSDRGRVRNRITKQILSVRDRNGYSQVTIQGRYEYHFMNENWRTSLSKPITLSVGRLVAATYIFGNNLKSWYIVKHLDKNPHNNSLENLDIKY